MQTEKQHSLRLFCFTFAVTSSFIISRTVADAVLLTRLGTSALPPMLILGALVVVAVSMLWARYTRALSLSNVVLTTQLTAALSTAILMAFLAFWPHSKVAIGCLYLLSEIRGCLSTILVALLLNEGTRRDSDKSRFALVNAGAPIAGIATGIFIGAEASAIDAIGMLKICCIFDLIAWIVLSRSDISAGQKANTKRLPSHWPESVVRARKLPSKLAIQNTNIFAKSILLLVACKVFVLAIVSYEWKVFAGEAFPSDEQALTAYFGMFYAITDGLILVIQLLLTRRFLNRIGMKITLFLLPLYLGILGVASLLTQDAWVLFVLLTLARGGIVLRRSLHDVVLHVLYGWLPASSRRNTVTRVLGIAKPVSEAVAASAVIVLAMIISTNTFAWLWLPVVLFWTTCIFGLLRSWSEMSASSGHLR